MHVVDVHIFFLQNEILLYIVFYNQRIKDSACQVPTKHKQFVDIFTGITMNQ